MLAVMDNLINSNQSTMIFFNPHVWLLDTIVNGILVVISIYLLLALMFHELRIEQLRKKRFAILSIEQKYGVLSKYTCIMIAIASFLRHSFSFSKLWIELNVVNYNLSLSQKAQIESVCTVLPMFIELALSIGSGLVFLFLWLRQRIFYVHPSMKILSNRCLKLFSFGIIVGWLLFYITMYLAYFIFVPVRFHYVAGIGCKITEESRDFNTYLGIAWVAMSVFMQLSLLILFVYPILKRTSWRGLQSNQQNTRLLGRVKKATLLALVCLGSDVVTVLISWLLFMQTSSNPTFEFGVNLVIIHLVTIVCFDHWKQLIWPWSLDSKSRSQSFVTSFTHSSTGNSK